MNKAVDAMEDHVALVAAKKCPGQGFFWEALITQDNQESMYLASKNWDNLFGKIKDYLYDQGIPSTVSIQVRLRNPKQEAEQEQMEI